MEQIQKRLKIIGEVKIPSLHELREGNWAPEQPNSMRNGPVFKILGEPTVDFDPAQGGILTGTFVIEKDQRKHVSRKIGEITCTDCPTEKPEDRKVWTQDAAKLEGPKDRYVVRVYVHPLDEIRNRVELIGLPTRNVGMGGVTAHEISAEMQYFVGDNKTPNGHHGINFYIVSLPYDVKITKTANNGRDSPPPIEYRVEDFSS